MKRTVTTRISVAYDECRWCGHYWHGLACLSCKCDGSIGCRDDSWRPYPGRQAVSRLAQIAHDTGVDGWAAQACDDAVGDLMSRLPRRRLKALLYGKS